MGVARRTALFAVTRRRASEAEAPFASLPLSHPHRRTPSTRDLCGSVPEHVSLAWLRGGVVGRQVTLDPFCCRVMSQDMGDVSVSGHW